MFGFLFPEVTTANGETEFRVESDAGTSLVATLQVSLDGLKKAGFGDTEAAKAVEAQLLAARQVRDGHESLETEFVSSIVTTAVTAAVTPVVEAKVDDVAGNPTLYGDPATGCEGDEQEAALTWP